MCNQQKKNWKKMKFWKKKGEKKEHEVDTTNGKKKNRMVGVYPHVINYKFKGQVFQIYFFTIFTRDTSLI